MTTRVEKIKKKYGRNAFIKWGSTGGSPILRAYQEGKLVRR
jgi:hypothetical protein